MCLVVCLFVCVLLRTALPLLRRNYTNGRPPHTSRVPALPRSKTWDIFAKSTPNSGPRVVNSTDCLLGGGGLGVCLFVGLSVRVFVFVLVFVCVCLFACLLVCLFVCLFVGLFV